MEYILMYQRIKEKEEELIKDGAEEEAARRAAWDEIHKEILNKEI